MTCYNGQMKCFGGISKSVNMDITTFELNNCYTLATTDYSSLDPQPKQVLRTKPRNIAVLSLERIKPCSRSIEERTDSASGPRHIHPYDRVLFDGMAGFAEDLGQE